MKGEPGTPDGGKGSTRMNSFLPCVNSCVNGAVRKHERPWLRPLTQASSASIYAADLLCSGLETSAVELPEGFPVRKSAASITSLHSLLNRSIHPAVPDVTLVCGLCPCKAVIQGGASCCTLATPSRNARMYLTFLQLLQPAAQRRRIAVANISQQKGIYLYMNSKI